MLPRAYLKSLGVVLASVVAAAVAGCGGNQAPANNAASPMSEIQREQAALPLAAMAPIPRGLHCKSPIVWVNLKTKSYHEKGDPYYGRTKNGEYMCQAAADAAGDHMAGTRHKGMNGESTNGGSMNNTSGGTSEQTGSMTSGTTRRHHRRSSSQSVPTPYPT